MNFAGLALPFLRETIAGREIDVLACEPAACPTLTRGVFAHASADAKVVSWGSGVEPAVARSGRSGAKS